MTSLGLSLLAVLLNVYLCQAQVLDKNGINVVTRYQEYYVTEGRTISFRYYKQICTRTCSFRFGFCFRRKTVCRNQARTGYKAIYQRVRKVRPVYYCKDGWRQSGSHCTIAACIGCYNRGYCRQPWICTCHEGWRGSQCQSDFNECARSETNKCKHKDGCVNTHGSFRCTCTAGYRLHYDSRTCNDVDECEGDTHSCSANGFCHNTQGSYRCSCKKGYQLGSDQRACQDVDECKTYQNDCDYKAGCQNSVGSFRCTCQAGYYLDADRKTCKDVDECVNSDCQQNCVNYLGGYNCSCNNGYRRNKANYQYCDDIDECFEKKDGCSQICTNKDGDFICSCNQGYQLTWDKKHCIDIDECSGKQHGCDHSCRNTPGSYECFCDEGYDLSSDGRTCKGKLCLIIHPPVNGNMACSRKTTGGTCVFSCSTGYKQIGSHIRRCTPSRRWTGKEAKCEPIYCPDPPEPINGFIYSPCDTRFNSECIAGCDDGFHINETSKLRCTVNGRWEPNKVTCNLKKRCEPNPCLHGGQCSDVTSSEFSCDCSRTGYKGKTCEIGFISIPDYPTIFADGTATSVEFRVSPPDNDLQVTIFPKSVGVEFNPSELLFKKKTTTSQTVAISAQRPGVHFVEYFLSNSGSAGFEKPETNVLIVESTENSAVDILEEDYRTFPSGCYSVERYQCPRSQVRITARSTRPWRQIFGISSRTNGIVSFSNGKFEIPYSITGDKFISRSASSLNNNCGPSPAKKYSLAEMMKRRVLTKSFLNVVRDSFPKWLDVKLRGNLSSRSVVEDDLKVHFLIWKTSP
ncbi:fibrillin-2-like [Dendronephthya gigantea]|uniref:fibrillin-2-like n=1 Tax=Dendronephthya gigantea TaxID=151771 RepID=UPI00106A2034|nr:fibrillin-2-like [Dendronephthya gigantea]